MKKINTIGAIAILVISAVSCTKSSSGYQSSNSTTHVSTVLQPVKVRIISDWQTLPFNVVNVNGSNQLVGQSALTQIVSYETATHKKLAYAKYPGRDGFVYKALPMDYPTAIGNHAFDFSLDFSTFKVTINNSDHAGRLVSAQDFSNFNYRYIIIPLEVYQSFQIDWNDLAAVAAALNFPL